MRRKLTIITNEEKTLKIAFEEFVRLKKISNIAEKSMTNYKSCYNYFISYIGSDTPCDEINNETILGYIEFLRERNSKLSDISINTYLRSLRTFLYFCMEQEYTAKFKISLIRAEKPLKETYSNSELEKLLKKPNIKNCSFSEYRNWVLICYLLGTGNRRKTVCNIKIGDLDLEASEIKLKTVKNKKHYTIPISPFLKKVLQEYLVYRKGTAEDYLFSNIYGQKLAEDGLKTCIKRYNQSRGVLKTGLHQFRHTFAKKWILNGGDPFRLKTILGHSTMAMVNEYVNIYGNDLQRDFSTFNPLDNMDCIKRNNGHIKM